MKLTDELKNEIIKVCKSEPTMAMAAVKIGGIHFNTFKRYAIKLGVYKPNPGGKGVCANKNWINPKEYKLSDILNNKYPYYHTYKLKNKLIKAGLKTNKCEECEITEWHGKTLNMELDHIDGNSTNHKLDNLRMLCPNCHAQTDTYRSKKE